MSAAPAPDAWQYRTGRSDGSPGWSLWGWCSEDEARIVLSTGRSGNGLYPAQVRALYADASDVVDAVQHFMPTGIALDNANIQDDQIIPLDVTMGELRRMHAALFRAPSSSPPSPVPAAAVEGVEKAPTLAIKVFVADGETDVQFDFRRDPQSWLTVRQAMEAALAKLSHDLATQRGCPFRPKGLVDVNPALNPASLEFRVGERIADEVEKVAAGRQSNCEQAARDVLAMVAPVPAAAVEGAEDRFWLILHEPGCTPERKGPWKITAQAETIREFIAARPTAYIDVLTWSDGYGPLIQHGPEVLQMLDGRSMATGRKHNARTREAHADHHTPPPADPVRAALVKKGDLQWLRALVKGTVEGGHLGEGTLERQMRGAHNDRVNRVLAALQAEASAPVVAENTKAREFLTNWFAPWGSWKTAWWEMEVSDDVEMTDANALKHLSKLLSASGKGE